MKCYIIKGRGVWLDAFAVVFADDEKTARDSAMMLFSEHSLFRNASDSDLTVREVPMQGAHLVWNGDY